MTTLFRFHKYVYVLMTSCLLYFFVWFFVLCITQICTFILESCFPDQALQVLWVCWMDYCYYKKKNNNWVDIGHFSCYIWIMYRRQNQCDDGVLLRFKNPILSVAVSTCDLKGYMAVKSPTSPSPCPPPPHCLPVSSPPLDERLYCYESSSVCGGILSSCLVTYSLLKSVLQSAECHTGTKVN